MKGKFGVEEIENLKESGLLHCGPPFRKSLLETTKYLSFTHLTIQEYLVARWFVMSSEIPKKYLRNGFSVHGWYFVVATLLFLFQDQHSVCESRLNNIGQGSACMTTS